MTVLDENTRLKFLKEMGIAAWHLKTPLPSAEEAAAGPEPAELLSAAVPSENASLNAVKAEEKVPAGDAWDMLLEEIRNCGLCHLSAERTNTVPGVGDIKADWLFIGEGPGYNEDMQGEPFVGRSGKLLDEMMAAMHLKRGENVYIANVVKCRAKNSAGKDRPPTEEEAALCMPYLERQIELIRPKVIVALGRVAAAALLNAGSDAPLSSMRNREHFFPAGDRKIPLVVTYHPSYLLRTPAGKREAWADLCRAMDLCEAASGK